LKPEPVLELKQDLFVRFSNLPDIEFQVCDLSGKEICKIRGRAAQDYIINGEKYIVRTPNGLRVGLA
jgi:hypothetical protein